MFTKRDILGIACEADESQEDSLDDESIILVGGKRVAVKKRNLGRIKNNLFIKKDALLNFSGPGSFNTYLLDLNSRGYTERFFVEEDKVLFLGHFVAEEILSEEQ